MCSITNKKNGTIFSDSPIVYQEWVFQYKLLIIQ